MSSFRSKSTDFKILIFFAVSYSLMTLLWAAFLGYAGGGWSPKEGVIIACMAVYAVLFFRAIYKGERLWQEEQTRVNSLSSD
jgi:hypothetical protein